MMLGYSIGHAGVVVGPTWLGWEAGRLVRGRGRVAQHPLRGRHVLLSRRVAARRSTVGP